MNQFVTVHDIGASMIGFAVQTSCGDKIPIRANVTFGPPTDGGDGDGDGNGEIANNTPIRHILIGLMALLTAIIARL